MGNVIVLAIVALIVVAIFELYGRSTGKMALVHIAVMRNPESVTM